MKYSLVKWRKEQGKYLLTVEFAPSWFERVFLRCKAGTADLIGSCTVWHFFPGFRRANTTTELVCADFWERIRYEERAAADMAADEKADRESSG